jgi:glycosyltransferase involved in cell wall biosynthesis
VSTVSVIIPAYGHAEYILQTLDSVFAQTFRDYEIIVVNDGSPDNTAAVLGPLIAADKIRYFEQPNQGVATARNFGISQAKGRYIALLDDDDLWPTDKLAWQVAAITDGDAVALGGSAIIVGAQGDTEQMPENVKDGELALERFFEGNPFYSPGQVLFRRDVFERGVRFDPSIWGADDLDFWIGLVQEGRFLRDRRVALYYRRHETNASRARLRMLVNCRKFLGKRWTTLASSQRQRCMAAGYRWLYDYLGRDLLWEARLALLSKRPCILQGSILSWHLLMTFAGTRRDAPDTFKAIAADSKAAFVTSAGMALKRRLGIRT